MADCNGDWEHQNGISIGTLDNPGWSTRINLAGTEMHGVQFDRVEIHRAEHDRYVCWVDDENFESACGPTNLGEALHTFASQRLDGRGRSPMAMTIAPTRFSVSTRWCAAAASSIG